MMEYSPLTGKEHHAPESVQVALKADFFKTAQQAGLCAEHLAKGEEVLFCERPIFKDGLNSIMFWMVAGFFSVFCTFVLMLAPVFGWIGTAVGVPVGLLLILLVLYNAVGVAKFHFYGYKIITNHRIALVIPTPYLMMGSPAVDSLYFRSTIQAICKANSQVDDSNYSPNKRPLRHDHFVDVYHHKTNARGYVQCHSPLRDRTKPGLIFCVETQLFEDILKEALKKSLDGDILAHPSYQFETAPKSQGVHMFIRLIMLFTVGQLYVGMLAMTIFYTVKTIQSPSLYDIYLLVMIIIDGILTTNPITTAIVANKKIQDSQRSTLICFSAHPWSAILWIS